MRISTKGRYGTRAMLELAGHWRKGPKPLRDIAQSQEITPKYLEQILIPLRGAGLIKSMRGANGGYLLARAPETITVFEIIRTMEGPIYIVDCVEDEADCTRSEKCAVRAVWDEFSHMIESYLSGITLADLVERQKNWRRVHNF